MRKKHTKAIARLGKKPFVGQTPNALQSPNGF